MLVYRERGRIEKGITRARGDHPGHRARGPAESGAHARDHAHPGAGRRRLARRRRLDARSRDRRTPSRSSARRATTRTDSSIRSRRCRRSRSSTTSGSMSTGAWAVSSCPGRNVSVTRSRPSTSGSPGSRRSPRTRTSSGMPSRAPRCCCTATAHSAATSTSATRTGRAASTCRRGSPGAAPAAIVAAAWAAMLSLGEQGYLEIAERIFETAATILTGVAGDPGARDLRRSDLHHRLPRAGHRHLPRQRFPDQQGMAAQRAAAAARASLLRHPAQHGGRRRGGVPRGPARRGRRTRRPRGSARRAAARSTGSAARPRATRRSTCCSPQPSTRCTTWSPEGDGRALDPRGGSRNRRPEDGRGHARRANSSRWRTERWRRPTPTMAARCRTRGLVGRHPRGRRGSPRPAACRAATRSASASPGQWGSTVPVGVGW